MRVQLIDPSAFTPPYDRALAAALARRGLDVELLTSRFLHGDVPAAAGYEVTEAFYRRTSRRGLEARGRLPFKLAEHVPDMHRLRRRLDADVIHWQWLTAPEIDTFLLPAARPRVLTAHYVAGRDAGRRELWAARRMFGAMEAVIAHSRHTAERLQEVAQVPEERIRVIPHGAFDYMTRLERETPLPSELAEAEGPVILFFGLLRPYKGLDVLLDAFSQIEGAELWIAGKPRMDVAPLREKAQRAPGTVRFVPRFITDDEIPALMRRADVVVLPYLEAEQSGVLYTGLAFGKPMVVSSVGGFTEVAHEHGAVRLVPPGDATALAAALSELVGDAAAREGLAASARAAASGPYSWDAIAAQTAALYAELAGGGR